MPRPRDAPTFDPLTSPSRSTRHGDLTFTFTEAKIKQTGEGQRARLQLARSGRGCGRAAAG